MKILWITNTLFPSPSLALGLPVPVVGGWMYGLAEQISKSQGIDLAVATAYSGAQFKMMKLDGILYFLLPNKNKLKYDTKLESFWQQVCKEFNPELVHIHGTEYAHGLACMKKLPHLKYVVSIQGLKTGISRYFYAGISNWKILKNITFRDVIRLDTIFHQKRKFEKHSELEKQYLVRTKHVIGRTKWDFAHTKAINHKLKYHFCNESLRNGFYSSEKWSFNNCNPNTIFLSQAGYPIKGLHQVIKAVAKLKMEYPDLKIRLGGGNITKTETIKDIVIRSGYGKYISSLLKKYKIKKDVVFLGLLSEEQMILEYKKAHVFICPSSIENSPNSLGEAQLLGVPTIASYVGGVSDMVEDGKTGLLYRFEEVEMLAENIHRIFSDNNLVLQLSENSLKSAGLRHNKKINLDRMKTIYTLIYE